MNDCLRTDVFVRYSPETIACSCIYLSARVLKVGFILRIRSSLYSFYLQIALPMNPCWFEIFDIKEEDIRDTCLRILSVYTRAKPDQLLLEQKMIHLKNQQKEEKMKESSLPLKHNNRSDSFT